jgi:hypothetical protein
VFVTMHIIFICYMPASCRKSPLPKPRSSLHLWIRPPPPSPPSINAIIPSSFYSTFLLPANQSFKDGRVFYSFVDAYFRYVLWPCIMQEKLYPRLRSSVNLWIRPSIPPLIHAIIPSSFHPSIPQLYIFKFLQK